MCIRDSLIGDPGEWTLIHFLDRLNSAADRVNVGCQAVDDPVSYTHLRAHETVLDIVCRLLLETKQKTMNNHHEST